MKTTKPVSFTPGPWVVVSGAVYLGSEPTRIALMDRNEPNTSPCERDSNARLIAASPSLYEALQLCEDVIGMARLTGELSDSPLSPVNDALMAARAALNKATGGQP